MSFSFRPTWPLSIFGSVACAAVALSLTGCHHAATQKNSQVVATVNGHEITASQLNQMLAAHPADAMSPDVRQQAMDSLVDEELLVQEALKHKLDRQAAVVQAIEKAKRQILARAYAESSVYARNPPTSVEIEQYFRDHSILFAGRKLFRVTAFAIAKTSLSASLQAELTRLHGTDQVRDALDKHGVEYETQFMSIAPEQLPIDRLPAFAKATVGEVLTLDQPESKVLVMTVTETHEAPIPLDRARPVIRQFLINSRQKDALAAYLKQSKTHSKIEYLKNLSASQDAGTPQPGAGTPTHMATSAVSSTHQD